MRMSRPLSTIAASRSWVPLTLLSTVSAWWRWTSSSRGLPSARRSEPRRWGAHRAAGRAGACLLGDVHPHEAMARPPTCSQARRRSPWWRSASATRPPGPRRLARGQVVDDHHSWPEFARLTAQGRAAEAMATETNTFISPKPAFRKPRPLQDGAVADRGKLLQAFRRSQPLIPTATTTRASTRTAAPISSNRDWLLLRSPSSITTMRGSRAKASQLAGVFFGDLHGPGI